jgi:hypothetical protein
MTQIYTGNLNCQLKVRLRCGTGHGRTSYHLLHGTGAPPYQAYNIKAWNGPNFTTYFMEQELTLPGLQH